MNNRGITLIEVLVTSVISMIVVGVTFSLVFIATNQAKYTILNGKLSMQYDIAVSQIEQTARSAKYILNDFDTYPPLDTVSSNCSTIWMKKEPPVGTVIGGYRVNGSYLEEYINNSWTPFRIGVNGPIVQVTPSSGFTVSSNRKQVILNLSFVCSNQGISDTLQSIQEVFLCRN
jgi:hypothetical protein